MADNIIRIPRLNPIKFRTQGFANPAGYNTKYFDEWNFDDTIRDFEQSVGHLQPWQKGDTIPLVFMSNYSPFTIQLQNCAGEVVDSFLMTQAPASTDISGLLAWVKLIPLSSYDEGVYRFVVLCGEPVVRTLESEWFQIKELHDNSYLLKYTHDENDFDIPFEIDITFQLRSLGGLSDFTPKTDRVVFIDQVRDAVQLDAKPYSLEKLYIGDGFGVPNWFIERINYIFLCSSVWIDGKQYTANEGAQVEPNREKDFPLAGWALEVRPSDVQQSKEFTDEAGEDGPITTLVYNIENRGFGDDGTDAADTNVQIIAND